MSLLYKQKIPVLLNDKFYLSEIGELYKNGIRNVKVFTDKGLKYGTIHLDYTEMGTKVELEDDFTIYINNKTFNNLTIKDSIECYDNELSLLNSTIQTRLGENLAEYLTYGHIINTDIIKNSAEYLTYGCANDIVKDLVIYDNSNNRHLNLCNFLNYDLSFWSYFIEKWVSLNTDNHGLICRGLYDITLLKEIQFICNVLGTNFNLFKFDVEDIRDTFYIANSNLSHYHMIERKVKSITRLNHLYNKLDCYVIEFHGVKEHEESPEVYLDCGCYVEADTDE